MFQLFYFLAPRSFQISADAQSTTPRDDVRLNQLDELETQDESLCPSVLAGLSGTVNNDCYSAIRNLDATVISDSISSDDASFVHPQDVSMTRPSAARKRDLSSYDSLPSRSGRCKASSVPGSHVPCSVTAAASLAHSRSSSSCNGLLQLHSFVVGTCCLADCPNPSIPK